MPEELFQKDEMDLYATARTSRLFSAVNPTLGTGIISTLNASFLATNGILEIECNTDKTVVPLYLRLIPTILAGGAPTGIVLLVNIDQGSRYSSGGSIIGGKNRNAASLLTGQPFAFGAITLTAETGEVRRVAQFTRLLAPVVGDEYVIAFGKHIQHVPAAIGTAQNRFVYFSAPIVLSRDGGVESMVVHHWIPGSTTTAASYEFELCWFER